MSCICEFCETELLNKRSLKDHQKTKKCVIKQNELKKIEKDKNHENEIKKLKDNYESELKKLTEMNKELSEWKERQFKKMEERLDETDKFIMKKANEPKIINNGIINNINIPVDKIDLSTEKINHVFDKKFIRSTINKGIKGFVDFIFNNFCIDENGKLLLACTDISRKKFRHRDENNKLVYDPNVAKLTKKIIITGKEKIQQTLKNYDYELYINEDMENEERSAIINRCKRNQLAYNLLLLRNNHKEYVNELALKTYIGPEQRKIEDNKHE